MHSYSRLAYMMAIMPFNISKIMSYQREPSVKQVSRAVLLSKKGSIITSVKAEHIRKAVMKLGLEYNQFLASVTKGKKDMDDAKETVKNQLDSLGEMGEMESLRLQMAMDRLSKMMSTLSNLLKKISDTASAITQNIK